MNPRLVAWIDFRLGLHGHRHDGLVARLDFRAWRARRALHACVEATRTPLPGEGWIVAALLACWLLWRLA